MTAGVGQTLSRFATGAEPMTTDEPTRLPVTVRQWRAETPDAETPRCPNCGRLLGIRNGMWRDNGRDAWLCENCGEMEKA